MTIKTIRMIRGESYPEPRSADVHPDEIINYEKAGFVKETAENKKIIAAKAVEEKEQKTKANEGWGAPPSA